MRLKIISIVIATLSIFAVCLAVRGSHADTQTTLIVADQAAGVVKIIVSGKEVARFNSSGLHVQNDIEYGGTLTDIGVGGVENYLGAAYGK